MFGFSLGDGTNDLAVDLLARLSRERESVSTLVRKKLMRT